MPCFHCSARATTSASRHVRWVLHFALVGTLLLGLTYVSEAFDLEKDLRSPWPWANKLWLPLLFACFYGFVWLGTWLWWGLLDGERPASTFADIDECWAEAVAALKKADIGMDKVPLFLLLGRPAAGADPLFRSAGVDLVVTRAPSRQGTPFQVCASRDAIYLSCGDTSLLGLQASLFAEHALLINRTARDEVTARLQHLCRLLAKTRHPYCPVNGMVLLLPLAVMAGATEASQIASLTQLDVQAVYDVLQVDCPCFAIVCDLEQAPGFREFIDSIPAADKLRPLGQRFPLAPDVEAHEVLGFMRRSVDVLAHQVLSRAIIQSFHTEVTQNGAEGLTAAMEFNFQLCRLLAYLRRGCQHLAQVLYRGTQVEVGTPAMIAGCYLVATGANQERDQAFARRHFSRVASKAELRRLVSTGRERREFLSPSYAPWLCRAIPVGRDPGCAWICGSPWRPRHLNLSSQSNVTVLCIPLFSLAMIARGASVRCRRPTTSSMV